MAVCLDTTFLVDLLAGDPAATAFSENLAEPVAVSAVSFYELLFGVKGSRRLARIEAIAQDYTVLPLDYDVCAMAAAIQGRLADEGKLIPVLDAMIAASAILADVPIVTSDEHFSRIPHDFGLAVRTY